jgi:hypothetical protein
LAVHARVDRILDCPRVALVSRPEVVVAFLVVAKPPGSAATKSTYGQ